MMRDATSLAQPEAITLVADDGYELHGNVYQPAAPALGTVLIHGATAVPQTFYARFAVHLASHGMRVVTYDFRGVGASRPADLRALDCTMTDWAKRDAAAAHAWVRLHHGDRPLALVGHSWGGQLLGLCDDVADADGALLVASQLGWAGYWPPLERVRFQALWRIVLPTLTAVTGYLPGWAGLAEDLPAGVAREWASWCLHPKYLMGHHADAAARFASFDRPVRLYSFTDDPYAPKAAVEALVATFTGADLDHRRLSPTETCGRMGHFGFFRPPRAEALWREAVDFLGAILRGEAPPRTRHVGLITDAELARDLRLPI